MTRQTSLWAVALTALVLALVLWQGDLPWGCVALETSGRALSPNFGAQKALVPAETGAGDGERAPTREEVAQPEGEEPGLGVRLLDMAFEKPLIGVVLNERGERLGETDREGRLRLKLDGDDLPSFEFRCSGYRSRKLAPRASELGEEWVVRLEPLAETTIETVTPDGAPAAGVAVRVMQGVRGFPRVSFRSLLPPVDAVWIEGTTDAAGRFSFSLAVPARAELLAPGGDLSRVQLAPGETVRVIVQLESARLTFVDAQSGAPLVGFVVETRDALDARQGPLRRATDADGQLLVATGSREFIVDLRDLSFASATCTEDPRITRMGRGYRFRFSELLPGESFQIAVERCTVRLQLVDALSQERLVGRVQARFENAWTREGLPTKWSSSAELTVESELVDGELILDCNHLSSKPSEDRLLLKVDGYQPAFVTEASLEHNAATRLVPMQPGGRDIRIQVLFRDRSPFRGTFRLRDSGTGSLSPQLKSDDHGWLPAQAWSGADVEVSCFSLRPPGQPKGEIDPPHGLSGGGATSRHIGLIASQAVRHGAAVLVLDYSPSYGKLVVRGVPAHAPVLLAIDEDGARHRATSVRAGEALFEQLPPGPYVIGPSRWLELLETQWLGPGSDTAASLQVSVEAGETCAMDWDSRWQLQAALEGRVRCAPGMLSELSLRPWYGSRAGSIPANDAVRIHLDGEGRYKIAAGQPRPEALLVCTSNSSYWIQVLQAFEPGTDTQVTLGSLKLTWDGLPPKFRVMVLYSADEPVFDTPFEVKRAKGYYLEWNTDRPLLLNAVSTFVHEVHLDVGKDPRRAFPVVIRAGEPTALHMSRKGGNPLPTDR